MTDTNELTTYIEAPNTYDGDLPRVFLAGGITDCPDWQSAAVDMLEQLGTPAALFNPRRANFPIHNPDAAEGQIQWEFDALRAADVILFWFSDGPSVQPIALYELGAHAANPDQRIVVGADRSYLRRQDVEIQLGLIRPDLTVHHLLADVCEEVRAAVDQVAAGGRAAEVAR